MNLFVLARATSGLADLEPARGALAGLIRRLPFLDENGIESWLSPSGRVGIVWAAHPPAVVGGVRYVHVDRERLACFSGRPFRWVGEREADGRSPLDAEFYLRDPAEWAPALDGRAAVAAYDSRTERLVVCTDPQGAYPLYRSSSKEVSWISNNAEVLRQLDGGGLDEVVLADMLGGGWSLSGDPVWRGVRRLAPGTLAAFDREGVERNVELLPVEAIRSLPGGGFDPEEAAGILVAAVRALADWPGRPSVLQLSGGRDSRTLLGACLAGGVEVEAITSGQPHSPDVRVARELARVAGIDHTRLDYDPDDGLFGRTSEIARLLALMTSGTVCLADTGGFPLRPREGPMPLWVNGQGGEIARGYYGTGEGLDADRIAARLYTRFVGGPPARGARLGRIVPRLARPAPTPGLLSREGSLLVERRLREWVDEQLAAGVEPRDVPDLFYLRRRMTTWAGPGHGWPEFGKGDTVSPLWSSRLLAQQLGGDSEERRNEAFHARVLDVLSPELAAVPFADDLPPRAGPEAADPLSGVVADIRAAVLDQPGHPAWEVISRSSAERMLTLDPLSLEDDVREYSWKPALWRLATIFMGFPVDQVSAGA